ncbi:MAG: hypothetical protein ACLS7Y_00445 [Thomasclavelia spiroformis]
MLKHSRRFRIKFYLEFWVKRDSNSGTDEQILFESENGAIKAVQKDTGKLGFTREGRLFI